MPVIPVLVLGALGVVFVVLLNILARKKPDERTEQERENDMQQL